MKELTKKQEEDLLEESLDIDRDIKYIDKDAYDDGDEDKEVYFEE
jgi:hypothetical protein